MIRLLAQSEFGTEWTECLIEGEDEEALAGILAARLLASDWDVMWEESEDGQAS